MKPRALLLTHVPLSPEFPNGFSARWHSFVRELGRDFEIDVIVVANIWDSIKNVSPAVFVPPDVGAVRVRVLAAQHEPPQPKTATRVLRSLRNLSALDRYGPRVPGFIEAIEAGPKPKLVVAFLHQMAELFLAAPCDSPVVFALEENMERLAPHTRPLEAHSSVVKRVWKYLFWKAWDARTAEIAHNIVRRSAKRGRLVAINPIEARQFLRWAGPVATINTVSLGIDVDTYAPQPMAKEFDIGVFGDLGQARNFQPARELYDTVKRLPGGSSIRWVFVGRSPHERIRALASDKVQVTGMVEDTRPWYGRCRTVAVPVRHATGSKTTVLKAAAMGCAVVTTPQGVAGLPLMNGRDLLVAANPPGMARALIKLLSEDSARQRFETAARAAVVKYCDQSLLAREFADICVRHAANYT